MDRKELIELQKKYTDENKIPFFAPIDGYCWYCGKDMVTKKWATELITGCPNCHKSYIE